MKLKSNKAITLVALIITIIVLLILAGVSINMLLGENGLINKSQSAINTYKEAENQENAWMNQVENYMDQMIAKNSYRDLVSQTPGNATSSDIRLGKTAWVNGELVTGTGMVVNTLWTNSSPQSNFGEQTISNLDLSPYSKIIIKTKRGTTSDNSLTNLDYIVITVGDNKEYTLGWPPSSNNNAYIMYRTISATSSSIYFSNCTGKQGATIYNNRNEHFIPLAIYGVL